MLARRVSAEMEVTTHDHWVLNNIDIHVTDSPTYLHDIETLRNPLRLLLPNNRVATAWGRGKVWFLTRRDDLSFSCLADLIEEIDVYIVLGVGCESLSLRFLSHHG